MRVDNALYFLDKVNLKYVRKGAALGDHSYKNARSYITRAILKMIHLILSERAGHRPKNPSFCSCNTHTLSLQPRLIAIRELKRKRHRPYANHLESPFTTMILSPFVYISLNFILSQNPRLHHVI